MIPLGAGHVDEKIRRRIWVVGIVVDAVGGGYSVDEKIRRRIWVRVDSSWWW